MAEQQQQEQQQQEQQEQFVAPGQYYPAFTTADGYSVPGGLFHPPQVGFQVPGQSFVGPPLLSGDGQPVLQMAPSAFQSAPLQIGIPGGFHFSPEYSDPPESVLAAPEPEDAFAPKGTVVTRSADVTKPKKKNPAAGRCPWCSL